MAPRLHDFLDDFPLVVLLDEETAERAACNMIGQLFRNESWRDFCRCTVEDELYTAPEFR